jgi:tetratricopeptide (TPR) repeat protein
MASRLLVRLDAQIARTREPVQLACLKAERAGFLGRHGRLEAARKQLNELQRLFAARPHVAVSGWIALAEGQLDHYENLGGGRAHDRFSRAHALSAAAGLRPLQALSAAWLAHSEDVRNHHERMAALCAEAWRLSEPEEHAARWRAALTVAGNYHFAGRFDLAQPWYTTARAHAMADGDDVAISALMYNQAALRIAEVRLASALKDPTEWAASGLLLGADATRRFDEVIGLQSLDWLVPLVRAQLLVMQDQCAEALLLIDHHWPRSVPDWRDRMAAGMLADRAWCLWRLGRRDEARADALQAREALAQDIGDVDDSAVAHARLAKLFDALDDAPKAQQHGEQAQRCCEEHRQRQQRLLGVLDEALNGLSPA